MSKQQPEAQQAQQPVGAGSNLVPIKYVGKKDQKTDNVADTGLVWQRGEIHYVPPLLAQKYKRHPGVWQEAWDEAEQDPGSVGMVIEGTLPQGEQTNLERAGQVTFDLPNLQGMTKADIATFAQTQYGTQLDPALKKEDMIQQVVALSNSRAAGEIE